MFVTPILIYLHCLQIVDLGLQVLDNVIMTRWKVLPKEQCQGERPMLVWQSGVSNCCVQEFATLL